MSNFCPFKKPGTTVYYNQDMLLDLENCEDDPIFFMENFCNIQTKGGSALFKPFEYQKEMIKSFVENRNSVLLTARQAGKCVLGSTTVKVRNKKTGEVLTCSIEEFKKLIKK